MWGRYVEGELSKASKGAKDENQAQAKITMRFKMLMREPEPESVEDEHKDFPKHLHREKAPTQFRDPAKLLRKG